MMWSVASSPQEKPPVPQVSEGVVIFILTKRCILVLKLSVGIVVLKQAVACFRTTQRNARHDPTEWKDRCDHRRRYRHRPRRRKTLHRGRRLRLHLRPPAGGASRRRGRARAQCSRGEGL